MEGANSSSRSSSPSTSSKTASGATVVDKAKEESSSGKEDQKKETTPKKLKSKFNIFGINKDKESSEEKAKKKEQANQRKNMAKGVGYSSYQQKGWDVKAYMAAQKEKDKQIELVLGKIHVELKKLHGFQSLATQRNLPDLVDGAISSGQDMMPAVEVDSRISNQTAKINSTTVQDRGGSRRKRKHSPDEIAAAAAAAAAAASSLNNGNSGDDVSSSSAASPIDPLSDLYAVLEGSALIPFLESKLQANSFLEICSHSSVYRCVISIIRELGNS